MYRKTLKATIFLIYLFSGFITTHLFEYFYEKTVCTTDLYLKINSKKSTKSVLIVCICVVCMFFNTHVLFSLWKIQKYLLTVSLFQLSLLLIFAFVYKCL